MNKEEIIQKTEEYVRKTLSGDGSGHDWWHVYRVLHSSFSTYKKSTGATINHFFEKWLLLKDLMNTSAAKKLALDKHLYMEQYLDRFFIEWEGKA